MSRDDPYTPDERRTFECIACGRRTTAEHQPLECPDCSGQLQDISVPRE